MAQLVLVQYPEVAANWGGKGTFRKLIESLDLGDLKIQWTDRGARILDPEASPVPPIDDAANWDQLEALGAAVQQMHSATGRPIMSPSEIQGVFNALAIEVVTSPFTLSATGKRVRDRCREVGLNVGRADISFVFKAILLAGHIFHQGSDTADVFKRSFIESMLAMSSRYLRLGYASPTRPP